MVLIRKLREAVSIATLSFVVLITMAAFLPNTLTPVYANFAGVGDWGCSSNTKNTVNNIVNHGASRTLSLGDMSYQDTGTCWFNIVNPIDGDANSGTSKKIRIAIGNHDDTPSSLLTSYKTHFKLGQLYYSFDIIKSNGAIEHFLVMNSEDPDRSNTNSDQYNFVKSDLANAASNPNVKWKILYVHQPFFSSPNGCSASSCKGSESFTKAIQPLIDQYHVDVVLFGHVHNYQRTFPLKFNSANPLNPTKTSTAQCDYTNPTGTIYAIVGTGGVNFHSLSSKASFVSVQQASRFGQLDLAFNSDLTKLTGNFYSNEAGTASGCQSAPHTLDRFTITKTFAVATMPTITAGLPSENGDNSFTRPDDPFT
jgi:Calcineurin-like phosphoesterase